MSRCSMGWWGILFSLLHNNHCRFKTIWKPRYEWTVQKVVNNRVASRLVLHILPHSDVCPVSPGVIGMPWDKEVASSIKWWFCFGLDKKTNKCSSLQKACMYRKCAFKPMWATSQPLLFNKIRYLNKFVCSPLSEWWRRNTFGNNNLHMLVSTLIYLIEQLVRLISCSQQQQQYFLHGNRRCLS